jgi:hypothetical protein
MFVLFQHWCYKSNSGCPSWLGFGRFYCAEDTKPDRVLRSISFISRQLWLFWVGATYFHYYCGCIYSMLHPEVEKTSPQDNIRHGERPVHHNQGQPMSLVPRHWELMEFLRRGTSDCKCKYSWFDFFTAAIVWFDMLLCWTGPSVSSPFVYYDWLGLLQYLWV